MQSLQSKGSTLLTVLDVSRVMPTKARFQ